MGISTDCVSILIAESFSCQRDLILNLKQSAIATQLKIYTAHSRYRGEILACADVALDVMPKGEEAVDWVLAQCQQHQIQLVFVGKNCEVFEARRSDFTKNNIVLITGALSLSAHQQINHKHEFTQLCEQHQLPVIPGLIFEQAEQLQQVFALAQQRFAGEALCAKPVSGVFGYGFVHFDHQAGFHGLFHVPFKMSFDDFLRYYQALSKPPRYLLMPFLTGQECSVDIACDAGKIISSATRMKEQSRQLVQLQGPCDEISQKLVALFELDGLINIQFKQDKQGMWHIMEINARPAGGFAYSIHTGRNLIADLIAHKLQFTLTTPTLKDQLYVYPYSSTMTEAD